MAIAQSQAFMEVVPRLIGWIYTLSWSASFYPQPLSNWKRRSTKGLTADFPALNVLGFLCYTTSQAAFLYSPLIRSQYAKRHPASPEPTTRFNDLAFGVHAVVLTALTYSQFYPSLWKFKMTRRPKMSSIVTGIVWGSVTAVSLSAVLALYNVHTTKDSETPWQWLDCVYTTSYVKLLCSFVKYIPQAWLNYKRKSTKGWSIWQIIFDAIGGILSLAQLIIDASLQGDWSGISGNPVKVGLALLSLMFDSIFITQHYILYRKPSPAEETVPEHMDEEPLLTS